MPRNSFFLHEAVEILRETPHPPDDPSHEPGADRVVPATSSNQKLSRAAGSPDDVVPTTPKVWR
jgi:hypothetical protein